MVGMTTGQLFKYEWRVDKFLHKYLNNEPFQLISGESKYFVVDRIIINAVSSRDAKLLNTIGLIDVDGIRWSFGKLEKTLEFGGKGSGAMLKKEEMARKKLSVAIERAKTIIKSDVVPVKIKNDIFPVTAVLSTPGIPKSDFHFVDDDGNENVWISHKDGRLPRDFQQWSGATEKGIKDHREVKKFVEDIKKMYDGKMPRRITLARKIKDPKLKKKSIYGVEFGSRKYGRQNVSVVLQGQELSLRKWKDYFILKGYRQHFNGEDIRGGYEPVLMASWRGDRSNFGIENARISIQPIEGRYNVKMI